MLWNKTRIRHHLMAGLVLCLWIHTSPCFAVIVFEKGKSEPVRGLLVSEDASRIIVQEILPGGGTRERIIPRAGIEDMIRAVSTERLAALQREKPAEYRDYAEELAEKKQDPEARLTAIRLYQIAAWLDAERLGRSSLLGMISLARSPVEERRFRALAFLLDPAHDRSVLAQAPGQEVDLAGLSAEDRKQLANMLRALREGRADDARVIAGRPSFKTTLAKVSSVLTADDFATQPRGAAIPPQLMRKVIGLELTLRGFSTTTTEPGEGSLAGSRSRWSQLKESKVSEPVQPLSLATITEFDPRNCHFREGKWQP